VARIAPDYAALAEAARRDAAAVACSTMRARLRVRDASYSAHARSELAIFETCALVQLARFGRAGDPPLHHLATPRT
jgi:phosphoenolpyruvate carboxylase